MNLLQIRSLGPLLIGLMFLEWAHGVVCSENSTRRAMLLRKVPKGHKLPKQNFTTSIQIIDLANEIRPPPPPFSPEMVATTTTSTSPGPLDKEDSTENGGRRRPKKLFKKRKRVKLRRKKLHSPAQLYLDGNLQTEKTCVQELNLKPNSPCLKSGNRNITENNIYLLIKVSIR